MSLLPQFNMFLETLSSPFWWSTHVLFFYIIPIALLFTFKPLKLYECGRSGILFAFQFSSVQSLIHDRLFATPWIAACQASLSITNSWSSPKLMSIMSVMPSSHLILCRSLLLLPPIPPSIRVCSNKSTLISLISGQSIGVSVSASVLPKKSQDWSPCSPRDSQESSPTPQFISINSSPLSFLHSPTLTSIHDHWKNHSLD